MMRQLLFAMSVGLVASIGVSGGWAQTAAEASIQPEDTGPCPKPEPDEETTNCVVFRLAPDVIPGASVQLYNGYRVKGSDWPALALASFNYVDDLGRPGVYTCSATLVGPRVLLTAAHCVDTGSKDKFRAAYIVTTERVIAVECDPDPRYFADKAIGNAPRNSFDFALCELSWKGSTTPVALTKITFESIDAKTPLKRQDEVVLTGYGCASMSVVDGAFIKFIPDLKTLRAAGEFVELARGEEKDSPATIRTRSPKGKEPALCKGDSGGPMLTGIQVVPPATADGLASIQHTGLRRVRGVNSSVDFDRTTAPPEDFLSRVSVLEGTGFADYVAKWRKKHKDAKICGWDEGVTPCQED